MDEKHPVFETSVLGALAFLFFWLTCFVFNPELALAILEALNHGFWDENNGVSETLSRWVAVGIFAIILGNIFQVFSVLLFGLQRFSGTGRQELAKAIRETVQESDLPRNLKAAVNNSSDDALFVWVHYSDPRESLITWGRWKLRYAYLAENWMVAIGSGILIGIVVPIVALVWPINCTANNLPPDEVRLLVGALLVLVCSLLYRSLNRMRRDNQRADLGMIAIYAAGILDNKLNKRFLPPRRQ